ncbi:MAG: sensor histidine kinase, partial [Bacteroidota bacterium]
INTTLKLDKEQLHFQVANSKEVDKSQGLEAFEEGGIGLTNIQKRLKLLYPNRHEFSMTDGAQEFRVDLKITRL